LADQPFPAAAGNVGQGGVDDLDQLLISAGWEAAGHVFSLTRDPSPRS
jgi:hypothetical protein